MNASNNFTSKPAFQNEKSCMDHSKGATWPALATLMTKVSWMSSSPKCPPFSHPHHLLQHELIYLFILLFRATSTAYGSSQARDLIRAVAAGLCRSHSNARSKPRRQPTLELTTAHHNTRSFTHWARPGIEPVTSWFLVGFVSTAPQRELFLQHEFIVLQRLRSPFVFTAIVFVISKICVFYIFT